VDSVDFNILAGPFGVRCLFIQHYFQTWSVIFCHTNDSRYF